MFILLILLQSVRNNHICPCCSGEAISLKNVKPSMETRSWINILCLLMCHAILFLCVLIGICNIDSCWLCKQIYHSRSKDTSNLKMIRYADCYVHKVLMMRKYLAKKKARVSQKGSWRSDVNLRQYLLDDVAVSWFTSNMFGLAVFFIDGCRNGQWPSCFAADVCFFCFVAWPVNTTLPHIQWCLLEIGLSPTIF